MLCSVFMVVFVASWRGGGLSDAFWPTVEPSLERLGNGGVCKPRFFTPGLIGEWYSGSTLFSTAAAAAVRGTTISETFAFF